MSDIPYLRGGEGSGNVGSSGQGKVTLLTGTKHGLHLADGLLPVSKRYIQTDLDLLGD